MIEENRKLILKELSARSFYGVKVTVPIPSFIKGHEPYTEPIELISVNVIDSTCTVGNRFAQTSGLRIFNRKGELMCKPYLRPMSSMTEEEKEEFNKIKETVEACFINAINKDGFTLAYYKLMDWLDKHHFDYRSLIPLGLAIEVTEENNPYKD